MSLKFQQLTQNQQLRTAKTRFNYLSQLPEKQQFSPKRIKKGNDSFQFTYGNKLQNQSSQKHKQIHKHAPNLSLFSDFDDQIANQSIAKQLIAQNMQLKSELIQIKKLAVQLESELKLCHQHIQNLSKNQQPACQHKQIILGLKNQIVAILNQNKTIQNQLLSLKSACSLFKITNINVSNRSPRLNEEDNQYEKIKINRSNSYEINKKYRNIDGSFKTISENKKSEQLLWSIKGMYSKIMGHKIESLKQLWRWLKNIGHYYSCFKKWRVKVQNLLYYSNPEAQDLICLIQQIISQIE